MAAGHRGSFTSSSTHLLIATGDARSARKGHPGTGLAREPRHHPARHVHLSPGATDAATGLLDGVAPWIRGGGSGPTEQRGRRKSEGPGTLRFRALLLARSTGLEPVGRAIGNLKQDALLPAIALILLGFVIPPRPVSPHLVPFSSPLEGHIGGTSPAFLPWKWSTPRALDPATGMDQSTVPEVADQVWLDRGTRMRPWDQPHHAVSMGSPSSSRASSHSSSCFSAARVAPLMLSRMRSQAWKPSTRTGTPMTV